MPFVDIHHVGDPDVGDPGEVFVVVLPAATASPRGMALVVAAQADDRDVDGFVRARPGLAPPVTQGPVRRLRRRSSTGSVDGS